MTKYKIVICDPVSGDEKKTVEFEEQIQDEAKAREYKLFLDACRNLPDGEYTTTLLRMHSVLHTWSVVVVPTLSCVVKDGESKLTVERVVYGKEHELLQELLGIHVSLRSIRIENTGFTHHANPIHPEAIKPYADKIIDIFTTLYSNYQPEYISKEELENIKKDVNDNYKVIENTFEVYGKTSDNSNYTSTVARVVGDIQLIIQSILGKLNITIEE